jgi:acetyl-CoA carboxylase biotin carboxyl carrier protein
MFLARIAEEEMTTLTDDDVLQILNLIEKSEFDFLEIENGDLKLVVKRGGHVERTSGEGPVRVSKHIVPEKQEKAPVEVVQAKAEAPGQVKQAEIDIEGFIPIKAPMVGSFYVAPEPGAPPFIEEGSLVEEDTQVGLIEVMKVFSSVQAGVRGTVSKILVSNAELVEYGQILFLVKPDHALNEKPL